MPLDAADHQVIQEMAQIVLGNAVLFERLADDTGLAYAEIEALQAKLAEATDPTPAENAPEAPGAVEPAADAESQGETGHCEHCGGFLDAEGQCNNPNCPGASEEPETPATMPTESAPEETPASQVETPAEAAATDEPEVNAFETAEAAIQYQNEHPERSIFYISDAFVPEAAQRWIVSASPPEGASEARPPLFTRLGSAEQLAPDARQIYIRRFAVQRGMRSEEPFIIDDPDHRREPFEFVAFDGESDAVIARAETADELRDALNDHLNGAQTDLGLAGSNFNAQEQAALAGAFARCEHCGAFLDREGNCNNPRCTGGGADETAASADEVEAAAPDPETDDFDSIPFGDDDDLEEAETLTQPTGHDYTITDADDLGQGGPKAKIQGNVAAIRLLKQLEEEEREATPEEQAILVKYVGWGGLPQLFDWKHDHANEDGTYGYGMRREKLPLYEEWKAVRELLTEEEFRSASRSTINAHYTSPTVVRGVWDALQKMGYDRTDGKILEPAAGIGHFFGMMPEEFKNAPKVGVELDATTAAIAKHLYQNVDVRHSGFEDTNLPDNYFDLAISNVPFGDYGVFDPAFVDDPKRKRMAKSIHNYFFAKSLDKVKPGGVVAFITSRYTMDGADPAVREYLASQADLVGALRLPNTAFKENAGTEVTTDVIFLRKRLPGEDPSDTAWVNTRAVTGQDDSEIHVNEYFADRPEMMLGKLASTGSMYGRQEVTLESDGRELGAALSEAIDRLPSNAFTAPHGRCQACGAFLDKDGQCNNPRCPGKRSFETKRRLAERGQMEGQYVIQDEGVYQVESGQLVPHEKSGQLTKSGAEAMELRRIRGMLPVNHYAREVLRLNVEEASAEELADAQLLLNAEYDAFVAEFGPLNSRANQRALVDDPNLPFLMALEDKYDKEAGTAEKGAMFAQRVIAIQKTVEEADSPKDALRVVLNESGQINWARMSELTGQEVADLQQALLAEGVVFQTPAGAWEVAEEYLSGNVREKLRQAEAAAALNPAFRRNVDALQEVMPRDLEPDEIKAALGSVWIPPEDIAAFAEHLFGGAEFHISKIDALAEWQVKAKRTRGYGRDVFDRHSAESMQIWGTPRADGRKLLQDALNGKEPNVYKKALVDGEEKSVLDEEATLAARERQAKIKE
jgi:predicted O-methyltransferase YrrM